MSITEKDKQVMRETVKEMFYGVKVAYALTNMEDPEMGDLFLELWQEQMDSLKPKCRGEQKAVLIKKKAMLSQPMGGKSDEEIGQTRERAMAVLTEKGYEVVNTLFTDEWYSRDAMEARGVVQIPLCFLAKSLENMSLCHTAYFCKGWENARGCRIEHEAAKAYGLEIIYEVEPE